MTNRPVKLWILVIHAIACALALLPSLKNTFGLLGYEFALVMSLPMSIAAAHLGVHFRTSGRPSYMPAMIAGMLVGPCVVAWLSGQFQRSCNDLEGLAFYVLMPLCSAAIAASVGVIFVHLLGRRRLALIATYSVMSASLLSSVWQFYRHPPVFLYNPFVGYFPGALYDEALTIPTALLWYRAMNIAWVAALVPLSLWRPKTPRLNRRIRILSLISLCVGISLYMFGDSFGFFMDRNAIIGKLGGHTRTAHFDIFFPQTFSPQQIADLKADHEFRYQQLRKRFGSTPKNRLRSFVFADAAQKQALMGAAQTYIAKPWLGEMYLHGTEFPHPVLKHELSHLFAAQLGDPILNISIAWRFGVVPHINMGLVEGLAVAAELRQYETLSLHEQAAALVRTKLAPPLSDLMQWRFYAYAGPRAYAIAGSFTQFLWDRYGTEKLGQLYRSGGDFVRSYNLSLTELQQQWYALLAQQSLSDYDEALTRATFHRPSIFHRPCPHEVANLHKRIDDYVARNAIKPALALWETICHLDPEDPHHQWERVQLLSKTAENMTAIKQAETLLKSDKLYRPLRHAILRFLGDQYLAIGQASRAKTYYDRSHHEPTLPANRRALQIRIWALQQPDVVQQVVHNYFEATHAGHSLHYAYRLSAAADDGVGLYLVAKQLLALQLYTDAAQQMTRALSFTLPSDELIQEALFVQGVSFFRSHQLERARSAFAKLAQLTVPTALRNTANDWIARCDWQKQQTPP